MPSDGYFLEVTSSRHHFVVLACRHTEELAGVETALYPVFCILTVLIIDRLPGRDRDRPLPSLFATILVRPASGARGGAQLWVGAKPISRAAEFWSPTRHFKLSYSTIGFSLCPPCRGTALLAKFSCPIGESCSLWWDD